ncbi:LOW QUALITY PROTEIN: P-loop containing nucleoside triphosphate hydrolase protein [Endogone sp. FLAS-F59071]|nr:LOW QUALITY PROTEIN: P-loop containing nucleoside triphosphate hydrolase protein [Endogone sp. FLAS-F59071]|eukprot:RUS18369.1 LOW QUALITY PROTEIN: P-loop containing nucleoside triphosphate hydrolase protein [Endogone sp. FLAS-F59071]
MSNSGTIVPILAPQTAIHIIASAELQSEDEELQKQEIGFLFKDASDDIKLNVDTNLCQIADLFGTLLPISRPSTMLLTGWWYSVAPLWQGQHFGPVSPYQYIISTVPSNNHVQITPATRISLQAPSARIPTDPVDSLVSSLASVSLDAIKPKGIPSLPGLEKAYDALLEIVSYPLIYPELIRALRIECPKGILLYGPPGVGKTFLVSSIAQACNAKVVTIHGPEVYGPYVGESEEKLRAKFDQAKAMTVEEGAPVILFIDELSLGDCIRYTRGNLTSAYNLSQDSLTPHRAEAQSHESRVVAQLLTLMDGVTSRGRIVVVGATNRPNAIDPALRRPGRFDREVSIDAPTELTRRRILESQTRTMPLADDVDISALARMTNGYVGADLASLCREAALGALDRSVTGDSSGFSDGVTMRDFQTSMSRVGPSMQRDVQVEVEAIRWEDIGGLEDVKKVWLGLCEFTYAVRVVA